MTGGMQLVFIEESINDCPVNMGILCKRNTDYLEVLTHQRGQLVFHVN